MTDQSENHPENHIAEIASELRIIRKLLTALLFGMVVLIGTPIYPEFAMLLAIAGGLSWLTLSMACALLNRAQRKRYEAIRFRELSGRSVPPQ